VVDAPFVAPQQGGLYFYQTNFAPPLVHLDGISARDVRIRAVVDAPGEPGLRLDFRRQPNGDTYALRLSSSGWTRTADLVFVHGGVTTVLKTFSVFLQDYLFALEIRAIGSRLVVRLSDVVVFDVADDSIATSGGFYIGGHAGLVKTFRFETLLGGR
jgi:hypothetical protein